MSGFLNFRDYIECMSDRISPVETETLLLKHLRMLPEESCALSGALGRVLRVPVVSDRPSPPYDRVMMDGGAIHSESQPVDGWYQVRLETPAGVPGYAGELLAGEAVGVSTGSVMPTRADTVVPVEELIFEGERFRISAAPPPGAFIHPAGSDLAKGSVVLPAGKVLGARDVAVAAGYGANRVRVGKKPVVGILTSGTELVNVDDEPMPHQVRRSNDLAVACLLQAAGFDSLPPVHLPDDPEQIRNALVDLLERCDVLFVCGGISKGKHDYLPEILVDLGCEKVFHRVKQKPGGPFGFWTGRACQVFGLPGNPLSTFVCTVRYGIPMLRAMTGAARPFEFAKLSTAVEIQPHPVLNLYKPFHLNAEGRAEPVPFQNSGDFIRPIGTGGLLSIPPCTRSLPAGSALSWIPW